MKIFATILLVLFGTLSAAPPNILFIITDDQGYPPLGANGHPWIRTPNIDKLQSQSTSFSRFLVSPTCAPTRSALMTGRHPMRNGVTHTIFERERMALGATTLADGLKENGYTTGTFGKWHLGDEDEYQPGRRGFDEVFIHGAGGIGQAYDGSCADVPGNSYFNPILRHNGKFVQTSGYCTDLFFEAAEFWMKGLELRDGPFFAYISTNAPHAPYHAEKNTKYFRDQGFDEKTAGFYGMIENIDENVGRIMGFLEESGLAADTVVIFCSDNGMTGGGSGDGKGLPESHPFFNAEMRGLKGSVAEGGVRVPFMVRWPEKIEAGRVVDLVAAHIDVLPTLLDLAGGVLPGDQVEGRSFLPTLLGKDQPWPDRYLVNHQGRWATGAEPNDFRDKNFAIRSQRFRLVGKQLFDMEKDPGQTTNVREAHPEVAEEMLTYYHKWWAETRPLMVNETAPLAKEKPFWVAYEKQKKEGGIPAWKPGEN